MYKQLLNHISLSTLCLVALSSCACQDAPIDKGSYLSQANELADAGVGTIEGIQQAIAHIEPTSPSSQVKGVVTFTKLSHGVRIVADLEGLTPGDHGFHVHEFGDCSKEGEAAGGHFNPTKHRHGSPVDTDRHVGDFGNITAGSDGKAHYDRVDTVIQLSGENSIVGHSLVIHSDPDDLKTQPSGASGKRIGCGIIEAVTIQ